MLYPNYNAYIVNFVSSVLPSGLNLNTTSGVISGIPTGNATRYMVTVTGMNSAGNTTTILFFTII